MVIIIIIIVVVVVVVVVIWLLQMSSRWAANSVPSNHLAAFDGPSQNGGKRGKETVSCTMDSVANHTTVTDPTVPQLGFKISIHLNLPVT